MDSNIFFKTEVSSGSYGGNKRAHVLERGQKDKNKDSCNFANNNVHSDNGTFRSSGKKSNSNKESTSRRVTLIFKFPEWLGPNIYPNMGINGDTTNEFPEKK